MTEYLCLSLAFNHGHKNCIEKYLLLWLGHSIYTYSLSTAWFCIFIING